MKIGKNRRGVSTVIAVLLMIIITVAAAVIVWAFLSGYIGARTAPASQNTVFQINALTKGTAAAASCQLLDLGTNATIVGVYVNGAAQTITVSTAKFSSTATPGTIVSITWTQAGLGLVNGDLVKIVCADGGAASATVL